MPVPGQRQRHPTPATHARAGVADARGGAAARRVVRGRGARPLLHRPGAHHHQVRPVRETHRHVRPVLLLLPGGVLHSAPQGTHVKLPVGSGAQGAILITYTGHDDDSDDDDMMVMLMEYLEQ